MEDDAVVFDFPDGGALFEIAVFAGVKDDAIACFEGWSLCGRWGIEADPAILCFGDGAEEGSTFFAKFPVC